jgi:hypothetical protein
MANQKIQLKSVNGNKLFPRTSINNIVGEDFTTVVSIPVLDGTGKIKAENLPSFVDDVIELIAVSETAPASCAAGDMYFNSGSTNKKIYTATAANTWGTTGVEPEKSKIYVNIADNKTYRWSGTVMTEIGKMPAVATTIRVSGTADDNHVASEKAVRDALVAAGAYTLPAATASELGGVKVAAVATSGINNASGSISIATASASQLGGVKIGSNITVSNGVISVAESTNSQKGVVLTKSTIDGNNASLAATDSAVGTVPTVWAVETALKAKQDKLTAGTGVSISNGTVSVADTVIYEVVS